MAKIMLDLPEGLYKVMAIDAKIAGVSIEDACIEYITDEVEGHLELPEFYNEWIKETCKAIRPKKRRGKRKVATR